VTDRPRGASPAPDIPGKAGAASPGHPTLASYSAERNLPGRPPEISSTGPADVPERHPLIDPDFATAAEAILRLNPSIVDSVARFGDAHSLVSQFTESAQLPATRNQFTPSTRQSAFSVDAATVQLLEEAGELSTEDRLAICISWSADAKISSRFMATPHRIPPGKPSCARRRGVREPQHPPVTAASVSPPSPPH
jgi:hypothetical protein